MSASVEVDANDGLTTHVARAQGRGIRYIKEGSFTSIFKSDTRTRLNHQR